MKHGLKTQTKLLASLLFAFLVLMQGCEPKSSSFGPTLNGFGVVVKPIGIDSGPAAKLYYKGKDENPTLVWPYVGTWGDPILYTNDVALLLADKPDAQGRLGSGNIIAIQGAGPAMDISNDILKIASQQSYVDFKKALRSCRPTRLQVQADKIEVYFAGDWIIEPSIPKLTTLITWEQVLDIMQDVKKTGKTNKVTNTDVLYLQKDYESE